MKETYESLIADFAKAENIDEPLNVVDQMKWIQFMRNITLCTSKEYRFHTNKK